MDPLDLAELERAIVESVAPPRVVEVPGWIVPLDDGAIGRAKSAAPLSHDADAGRLDEIEAAYADAGLSPGFRVAEVEGLQGVRAELVRRGYQPQNPTIMKTGSSAALAGLTDVRADLLDKPDEPWLAAFAGEGFAPAESAQRVANLNRSPDALFGAVREGDRTVAVGVVSFGRGWAGIHGMRTAPDRRRLGLASRVLAAFGAAALARGVQRTVLQVQEPNPARILYRQAGFTQAWRYHYWRKD